MSTKIVAGEKDFPTEFTKIEVPSTSLYYRGDISLLNSSKIKKNIAVIGSRMLADKHNKSKYPKVFETKVLNDTKNVARELSNRGFTIVSGGAFGNDTAGHRGSLESTNKKTIAILAGSVTNPFPPENKPLFDDIISNNGLIISEQNDNTKAKAKTLKERDRLQVAASSAVFVGNTTLTSGTSYAIAEAIRQNKPVIFGDKNLRNILDLKKNKTFIERHNLFSHIRNYTSTWTKTSDPDEIEKIINDLNKTIKS